MRTSCMQWNCSSASALLHMSVKQRLKHISVISFGLEISQTLLTTVRLTQDELLRDTSICGGSNWTLPYTNTILQSSLCHQSTASPMLIVTDASQHSPASRAQVTTHRQPQSTQTAEAYDRFQLMSPYTHSINAF